MVPEKMRIVCRHIFRRLGEDFPRKIFKTFAGVRIWIKIADQFLPFDALSHIGIKQHTSDIVDGHIQKPLCDQIQLPENLFSLLSRADQINDDFAAFLRILQVQHD